MSTLIYPPEKPEHIIFAMEYLALTGNTLDSKRVMELAEEFALLTRVREGYTRQVRELLTQALQPFGYEIEND